MNFTPNSHNTAMPGVPAYAPMHFLGFVALLAALMAIPALLIDTMLPALPNIGRDLAVASANHRQLVIGVFLMGLAAGSLFMGSLSDRFGRKPVILVSLALCITLILIGGISRSFPLLLASRVATGLCAGACRVIPISIARDCFSGDQMARVLSLTTMVFMVVPIVAPTVGVFLLTVLDWRQLFVAIALFSAAIMGVAALRMPETLKVQNQVGLRLSDMKTGIAKVLSHRTSMGYSIALGLVMGGTMGFVMSVQQIVSDAFGRDDALAWVFASIAIWMALGSFVNSRLVQHFGSRRLSQGAIIAIIVTSIVRCLWIASGHETLASFIVAQAVTMFCLSMAGANANSVAMEPFARGAGLASSLQSFISTMLSALLGTAVGASFNGTTLPLSLSILLLATAAIGFIIWGERGRLFMRSGPLYR